MEKIMSIGLLTFHQADNYGAVLQAYALQEALRNIDNNIEIINYYQPYIIDHYKILNTKNKKKLIKAMLHSIANLVKKYKFSRFRKIYLDITEKVYVHPHNITGKDTYIVGSDQIWNKDITNFDETFFLNFCETNVKKIAYAASIGNDFLNNEDRCFLKKHLQAFHHISVREDTAKKLLKELTDKEIVQVLDPTLLVPKIVWNKLLLPTKVRDKYLLIYMVNMDYSVFRVANCIAERLDLKIYFIDEAIRKKQYVHKNVKKVGPLEFLTLISDAAFVVTNSFHGTAFSIVFNKDFVTVPTVNTGSRMLSLLKLLKLRDRIITEPDEIKSNYNLKIEYIEVKKVLEKERLKSLQFLQHSIESETGIQYEQNQKVFT